MMASSPSPPSGAAAIASNQDVVVQNEALRLRTPRSLPPWIDSYEERYGAATNDQFRLLRPPERAQPPQHNATPGELQRRVSKDGYIEWHDPRIVVAKGPQDRIAHFLKFGRASMRGRKWDHLRSAEPVIVSGYTPVPAQAPALWGEFIHSSAYGTLPNEESEIVDPEVLDKLQPTFNEPVEAPLNPLEMRISRRRKTIAFYKRFWNITMSHPLSPLVFRLTVMITSILALGIAAKIFGLEDQVDKDSAERTQSVVAVAVDSVAIPYIGYMIWDEYTGKPLGLRSANSKMALILLDLFFIIFKSASTALAFESLVYHNIGRNQVLHLSEALAGFMLIGLIAWSMTFSVNIFRTVRRLGGGEDD